MSNRTILLVLICVLGLSSVTFAQRKTAKTVPPATLLLITKAEDERRWDDDLRKLFLNPNAVVRQRAALATGRIGDEDSISALTGLLEKDNDQSPRC